MIAESKKLAPMLENVRANLSESREICGELFKMVQNSVL